MTVEPAPRRRGRPRTVEGQSGVDPAEEILHHAARLFSSNGLGATRLSDIADAVGVKPPAIYYHFANLDAIVEHLLRYVVEESAAFATQTATAEGTSGQRLRALVEQHVRRLTDSPYDLWFVAGMSDADGARFPDVGKSASRWQRAVATLFEEGRAAGEFRDIDTTVALGVISGLVYGALELNHHACPINAAEIADIAVASVASREDS